MLFIISLSGCGLYKKYEKTVEEPADVFGTSRYVEANTSDASIAQISWREFFPDAQLQQLIAQALENNTDLNSARIAVEKSEASLQSARLAYLPSLFFSPQQALYDNGQAYSTAVNQQESAWLSVKTQIVDILRAIRATENSLCSLLAITPQRINRTHWGVAAQAGPTLAAVPWSIRASCC